MLLTTTQHAWSNDFSVPLFVVVTVNGENKGDLLVRRDESGQLWLRQADLGPLGLKLPELPAAAVANLEGEPHISLQAQTPLAAVFHPATLSLDITVDPHWLVGRVIDARPPGRSTGLTLENSAFMNWAVEQAWSSPGQTTQTLLSLEGGVRLGPLLLTHQTTTRRADPSAKGQVRLATTATYDLPGSLQRWTGGDFITTSTALGSSLQLGGIALSKHYGLDPYQIRYPLGRVQGQALLPSQVDVYVDGQRVRSERVAPGDFEIRDLYMQQGARSVQLVVGDPYGRTRQFDYSLYTSDQLLQSGLHEYQYALGRLRRQYGTVSADYGPLALAAHHRYGVSQGLTLGLRMQASSQAASGGPLATLQVGAAGTVSGALAASRTGGFNGTAFSLQYAYQGPVWGLGLSLQHESNGYATLNEPLTLTNRKGSRLLYVSRPWSERSTLTFSHARQTVRPPAALPAGFLHTSLTPRQVTALGYGTYLSPFRSSLRLTLSRTDEDKQRRYALNLSLTMALDGSRLLSAQTRQDTQGATQSVQWSQLAPSAGGWGFDLAADHGQGPVGTTHWRAATQVDTRYMQWRGQYRGLQTNAGHPQSSSELQLSASGGLAWIDGQLHGGQAVQGGFVVAKVGDNAGVPVTVNHSPAGVTGADGQLFIPRMSPHQEVEIAIDPQALPIDQIVSQVRRRIRLAEQGGAVVDFGARPMQALVVRLVQHRFQARAPVAQATVRLMSAGREHTTITGRDGELYLENLALGRHTGQAQTSEGICHFQFENLKSREVVVDLGEVLCEGEASQHTLQNPSPAPR